MTGRPEYKVTALRQGTVIDHLPPGMAIKALDVLGYQGGGVVTIGMFLESRKWGHKDIIKIENKELTWKEVQQIALLGTHTTISIIRDFKIVDKMDVSIPSEITGVIRCPNPACITNHDPVTSRFNVEEVEPMKMRCGFCETIIEKDELELL
jgi:aspartate carbamoyltransferase regulatory subunit